MQQNLRNPHLKPGMKGNSSPTNHVMLATCWLAAGVILCGLFMTGQLLPVRLTICVLAAASVFAIASLQITALSIMTRLYILLYILPFAANLGYLFDRNFVWWQTPTNILLCQNHTLINEMLTMVLVGLCGLMTGIEWVAMSACQRLQTNSRSTADVPGYCTVMPLPIYGILLYLAYLCSWIYAPEESIFTAAYASADAGGGMYKDVGMNSSYLVSYLLLMLLVVDAEREAPRSSRRMLKLMSTLMVTAYIVVVLQLLRGDRECAGLLAALVMLYITSPSMEAARGRIQRGLVQFSRTLKIFIPLAVCVAAFIAMGSLRHSASQKSSEFSGVWNTLVEGATQNTWTAVALNNLGLCADYNYKTITYLYGQTYVDYFLSLPPGSITMAMGYERPLESNESNPSMWYHGLIAAGGMHPAVVPFRNFGIVGVLIILILEGAFICFCETYNENGTLASRLLYGAIATSCMLWFWYGDMNFIRTVMMWWIVYVMHYLTAFRPFRGYERPRVRPSSGQTSRPAIGQTQKKPATALT